MWLPLVGILAGILIGLIMPFKLPVEMSSYLSIAILAALDTVFGGIRAMMEDHFQMDVFLTGFFGNALLAAGLAYMGDRLNVPIYLAAIFAFGTRLFHNFAAIRRYLLEKLRLRTLNRGQKIGQ